MTDLKELRELAEKYAKFADDGVVAVSMASFVEFARAVLSATEPEKPKEPRKIGKWAVVDKDSCVFFRLSEEEAIACAAIYDENHPTEGPHWVCYMFGTEGVGPQDAPKEEKREAREWWINMYENSLGSVSHLSKEDANKFALQDRTECVHVREVI